MNKICIERVKIKNVKDMDKKEVRKFYNSNNHFEYTPFVELLPKSKKVEKKTVLIFKEWFNGRLCDEIRNKIKECLKTEGYDLKLVSLHDPKKEEDNYLSIKIPHENNRNPIIYRIYHIVGDWFTYDTFKEAIAKTEDFEVKLVNISSYDLRILKNFAQVRVLSGRRVKDQLMEDLTDKLINDIQKVLDCKEYKEVGWFVKTKQTSGKNDFEMKPVFTVKDVIENITGSKKILFYLGFDSVIKENGTQLVFVPWRKEISKKNEFRVIIENRIIKGIAQQHWYTKIRDFDDKECYDIVQKISDLYYLQLKNNLPYYDMILDVWIDEKKAHLIEVNPNGLWGSSGSSCFHYILDYDILFNQKDKIYFRIVDLVSE